MGFETSAWTFSFNFLTLKFLLQWCFCANEFFNAIHEDILFIKLIQVILILPLVRRQLIPFCISVWCGHLFTKHLNKATPHFAEATQKMLIMFIHSPIQDLTMEVLKWNKNYIRQEWYQMFSSIFLLIPQKLPCSCMDLWWHCQVLESSLQK